MIRWYLYYGTIQSRYGMIRWYLYHGTIQSRYGMMRWYLYYGTIHSRYGMIRMVSILWYHTLSIWYDTDGIYIMVPYTLDTV